MGEHRSIGFLKKSFALHQTRKPEACRASLRFGGSERWECYGRTPIDCLKIRTTLSELRRGLTFANTKPLVSNRPSTLRPRRQRQSMDPRWIHYGAKFRDSKTSFETSFWFRDAKVNNMPTASLLLEYERAGQVTALLRARALPPIGFVRSQLPP